MEKLFNRIKSALSEILVYLSQKKVIFAFSLVAFLFYTLQIYDVNKALPEFFHKTISLEKLLSLCLAFSLGTVFSIPAVLLSERFAPFPVKKYTLQILSGTAGTIIGYFAREGFTRDGDIYGPLYYFGIVFAVVAVSIFLFIPKSDSKTYFALVFKHFFFCSLLSTILCGGMCLLVYAVQNLILNTDESCIYDACAAFSFFVIAVNSFSYHLFYKRSEESSGKAFKIIMFYIFLPVFTVLLLILYAYLIKALVLLTLPNGQINWFVSFASCFFILSYFILREFENLPAVRFFYRFGAFAFIPLICVQIPAFFIRVNAYGFTGYRYSSLLFIIFSVLTIALTFIKKGKFTKYSLLLLAFFILLDTLSPCNLIDMAYKSQYGRMMNVLEKYEMFNKEKDALSEYDREKIEQIIEDDDRASLYSAYRYITGTSEIPDPQWMMEKIKKEGENAKLLSFQDLFGIKKEKEDSTIITYKHRVKDENTAYDIASFSRMVKISASESSGGWVENKYSEYANELPAVKIQTERGTFDATDFILSLAKKKEPADTTVPIWYTPEPETTILFESLSFEYNEDNKLFKRFSYSGYEFHQ
ncbi:DUF4153 domain-containing protein [Treponema sp.]|uniref:DUF4153 domain-containing protein n=1 Tax=Treponema sp. TaxID=166 RepID=UPI00388D9819